VIPLITGAQITFWVVAPISAVAGLGVILARRIVHAALSLAALMIGLGVLYATLDAPFLFVAQLIVYLGSVMMVFVFAMMLIGIDTTEDLRETIKGHRILSVTIAVCLAAVLVVAVAQGFSGSPVGLAGANTAQGGNAQGVAILLFSRYVLAFEATAALVITAALGAMVLAHRERLAPKTTQKTYADARMRAYATRGTSLGPLPGSGVYARHNSVDYPGLLPDGTVAPASVSPALQQRGQSVLDPRQLSRPVIEAHNELMEARAELTGEAYDAIELPPPPGEMPAAIGTPAGETSEGGEAR